MSNAAAAGTPNVGLPVVAFVGLGNMGTPMARRLVEAGYTVRGTDLSADARDRLTAVGGVAETDAAAAVTGADVVVLMLPDSSVVSAVVHSPSVTSALSAGTVIVDMSSSEPMSTRVLAEELDAAGVRLVDAPVSGGVRGAENGKLDRKSVV